MAKSFNTKNNNISDLVRFYHDVKKDYIKWKLDYLLYAYLLMIIIWFAHIILIHFGLIKGEYHSSFSASLLEDIIFFGILGTLLFIYSQKDGSHLSLRDRVSILANKPGLDNRVITYLYDNIKPILAYNESTNIDITIDEISEDSKYVAVYTDLENIIVNMCNNDSFVLEKPKMGIMADHEVNNSFGYISYAGIKNIGPKGGSPNYIPVPAGKKVNLKEKKKVYQKKTDFVIPENGQAQSKISWLIWEKLGQDKSILNNWFAIENKRFSNKIHLDIKNSIKNRDLFCTINVFSIKNKSIKSIASNHELIRSGPVKVLDLEEKLFPGDEIQIFFSLEKI